MSRSSSPSRQRTPAPSSIPYANMRVFRSDPFPSNVDDWVLEEPLIGPAVTADEEKGVYGEFMCLICGRMAPAGMSQPYICGKNECKETLWAPVKLAPNTLPAEKVTLILAVMVGRTNKSLLRAKPFKHFNQLQWWARLAYSETIEGAQFYREFDILGANKAADPVEFLADFKRSLRLVIQQEEQLVGLASHVAAMVEQVKAVEEAREEVSKLQHDLAVAERALKDNMPEAARVKVDKLTTAIAHSESLLRDKTREVQSLKDKLDSANKNLATARATLAHKGGSLAPPTDAAIKLVDGAYQKVLDMLVGVEDENDLVAALENTHNAVREVDTLGIYNAWFATLAVIQKNGVSSIAPEVRGFAANFATPEAAMSWTGWYGAPIRATLGAVLTIPAAAVALAKAGYTYATTASTRAAAKDKPIWKRVVATTANHAKTGVVNAVWLPYAMVSVGITGAKKNQEPLDWYWRPILLFGAPFVAAVTIPLAVASGVLSYISSPFSFGGWADSPWF